jgi:hypothetical protein
MPEQDDTTRIPDDTAPATEDTTWLGPWQQPEQPEQPEEDSRTRGTHPLQTGYLVVGLLALGIALMWLLTDQGLVGVADGGVAFSVVLVTAGAVGLVASLGRGLRRR